ncbi:MAG: hypothetical protein CL584_17200 [Alteromonadaceae bacterium]|nr:hypothetical protein [Alteromonadaceae bacterium]
MNPANFRNTWVVFCLYSQERVTRNYHKLEALLEILLRNGVEGIVLVDNSSGMLKAEINQFTSLSSKVQQLRGSNKYGEFSAWVEGMEYIVAEHGAKSFVLFNDTVFSHFKLFYWKIINFLSQIERYSKLEKPVQLGETVKLPYQSVVMGISHKHFVRSALFYLNESASSLFIAGCHRVFQQAERAFCETNSFEMLKHFFNESGAYHVGRWLFSGGWYGSKPYDQFAPRLLELKVTAIACEHLSSATCIHHGGKAADSNLQRNFNLPEQIRLFKSQLFGHPLFSLKMLRKLRGK